MRTLLLVPSLAPFIVPLKANWASHWPKYNQNHRKMFIRFLACSKKDLSLVWKQVCKRVTTNVVVRNASGNSSEKDLAKVSDFVDGSEAARQDFRHLAVLPDFISEEEEAAILQEVDNSFRRSKYQYSHWDEVCQPTLHPTTAAFVFFLFRTACY